MIKIKHFMDAREEDDGERLWVEPTGLTKDLVEWCAVDHLLPHLGPQGHRSGGQRPAPRVDEAQLLVGVALDVPAPLVQQAMVVAARHDQVGRIGGSPLGPMAQMVGVQPAGAATAGEATAPVSLPQLVGQPPGDLAGAAAERELDSVLASNQKGGALRACRLLKEFGSTASIGPLKTATKDKNAEVSKKLRLMVGLSNGLFAGARTSRSSGGASPGAYFPSIPFLPPGLPCSSVNSRIQMLR